MRRRINKRILVVLGLLLILIGVSGALFLSLQSRTLIANYLERKLPAHINLDYQELRANLLLGNFHFKNLTVMVSNRDLKEVHTILKASDLEFEGLSYWHLISKSSIYFDDLSLNNPLLHYFPHKKKVLAENDKKGVVNLIKTISIKRTNIRDGEFQMLKENPDERTISAEDINFSLIDARVDPELITNKIPLSYTSYSLVTGKLKMLIGDYELLTVEEIKVADDAIAAANVSLVTRYDKGSQPEVLKMERDHISLNIPKIELNSVDFGYADDEWYGTILSSKINRPVLNIYRDKSLPDDRSNKKMYGQILRELPFKLHVPLLHLNDGQMIYEEKIAGASKAGTLQIDSIQASISMLSNSMQDSTKTILKAHSKIMGQGNMTFEYQFDPNNPQDTFLVSGSLGAISASKANPFLVPNAGVRLSGFIEKMYFTIYGNATRSRGDMKMKYDDFKFEVLQSNNKGINKVLTFIGNIFVNDGSNVDSDGFRHGKIYTENNKTKSFFNYVWRCVQDGILKTMTGDGKKDN